MKKNLSIRQRELLSYLWYLIPVLFVVTSVVACIKIISMGILPWKYVFLGFLFGGLILSGLFVARKKEAKRFCVALSVLSVVFSIVIVCGLVLLGRVTKTVDKVASISPEKTRISVLVAKGSNIIDIGGISGTRVGLADSDAVRQTVAEINSELTEYPSYACYDYYVDLIDALLAGEEDAAIIEDALLDVLDDIDESNLVENKLTVLKTYDIVVGDSVPNVSFSREAVKISDSFFFDEELYGEEIVTAVEAGDCGTNSDSEPDDESGESTEIQNQEDSVATEKKSTGKKVVNTGGIPNTSSVAKTTALDWSNDIVSSGEGCFIAYISGIDTLGDVNIKRRSDVNILAVVNANTGKIQLISTPRDYFVILPNVGQADKLTHAGIYGVDNSIAALENLYGINVDYYLRMNFTGFVQIIDTLGGIDVWSDYEFTVEPVKTYTVGLNHLNGVEALAFARERYSFSSGDVQRSSNQMAVIKAMIGKMSSTDFLYNFGGILESISNCIQTSMPADVIYSYVNRQLSSGTNWQVDSYTTTGYGASAKTYTSPKLYHYVMTPNDDNVAYAHELITNALQR